jgi:hypothetical protein
VVTGTSGLLYFLVERPARAGTRTLQWSLSSVAVILLVAQVGVWVQEGLIPRQEMLIYQAWSDRDEYRCGKIKRILAPGALSCEITAPVQAPTSRLILVGNSHADSIKAAFADVARSRNVSVFFMVENNPLMKGGITPEALVREAQMRKATGIVLHYSPDAMEQVAVDRLAVLSAMKGLRLSLVMPVPVWDVHIPMTLWKHLKQGGALPQQQAEDYLRTNGKLISHIAKIDSPQFKSYPVADALCRTSCAVVAEDGRLLYFDKGHLTRTGSALLRGVFEQVIDDLL